MKKKFNRLFIIPIFVIILVLVGVGTCIYFVTPVSSSEAIVEFDIKEGSSSTQIISDLKKKKLIKSIYFTKLYYKINDLGTFKAGSFELTRSMSLREVLKTISNSSNIKEDSVIVTFIPGTTIKDYASVVNKNFGYSEEEFINTVNDKEYIKTLIEKYDFLTDEVLNEGIYYPLEGYLAPDTYNFNKNSSIKDIIEKLLDQEAEVLKEYSKQIKANGHTIHHIITMASIAESEGKSLEDRKNIVGVFYNRLNSGDKLGSDVTTYYGAGVKMSERDLYDYELNAINGYNTRSDSMVGKIPVGPICNPSHNSIEAAINYIKNDYYFFVSDKNSKIYFNKTNAEHNATINRLISEGLWFEY